MRRKIIFSIVTVGLVASVLIVGIGIGGFAFGNWHGSVVISIRSDSHEHEGVGTLPLPVPPSGDIQIDALVKQSPDRLEITIIEQTNPSTSFVVQIDHSVMLDKGPSWIRFMGKDGTELYITREQHDETARWVMTELVGSKFSVISSDATAQTVQQVLKELCANS